MKSPAILVVLLSAFLPLPSIARADGAAANGGFPDAALRRAVEEQGRRYVEALDAEDEASRRRVLGELFVPAALAGDGADRLLRQVERVHADLGPLEFHHAEAFARGEGAARRVVLHAYVRSAKAGGWRDLQFMLENVAPHRMSSLLFIAEVAEPIYLPNGAITDADTRAWLDGYVDRLVAEEDLAGGLLVAVGDRVLLERTFGHADAARRRPVGPRTRFSLASGGKMFTAVVLMQLVQEGRVRLDAPLSTWLPALADRPYARVTPAQLLSHTSGIGDYWTGDFDRHRDEVRALADYLPWVDAGGIAFPPGARSEYSNSNFILAGLVIEAVTGHAYEREVAARILEPLGMRDTGFDELDAADPRQAEPLARIPGGWAPAPHGRRGSAAGGALSTLGDMLRFSRGLVGGRLVADTTLARMTAPQPPDGVGERFGYGFILEGSGPGTRSFGHGGIAKGMNFEYRYFPASDITLVAFSNQDNGAYDDLRKNVIRLVTGER